MSALTGQRILLGITAGIAAYKTPELVRELIRHGAEVRVVMTEGAKRLVSPLALQAVSGSSVQCSLWGAEAGFAMDHIALARWPTALLVAPATANHMAKVAAGIADDLLTTLILATSAPIYIAPAMNVHMWASEVVQQNKSVLQSRSMQFIGPAQGEQACGDVGLGRMVEPQDMVHHLTQFVGSKHLAGKKVVVTAGPTREAIDPMRFITNKSTGQMGYALAEAAQLAGAEVILISGPTELSPPAGVRIVSVSSADDMAEQVMQHRDCNIFIGAAAVADYTPADFSMQKIKKSDQGLILQMKRTRDIIQEVSQLTHRPFIIGFCAETQDLIASAKKKRKAKKMDWVIANDISTDQAFGDHPASVALITEEETIKISASSKRELARRLIQNLDKHTQALV